MKYFPSTKLGDSCKRCLNGFDRASSFLISSLVENVARQLDQLTVAAQARCQPVDYLLIHTEFCVYGYVCGGGGSAKQGFGVNAPTRGPFADLAGLRGV